MASSRPPSTYQQSNTMLSTNQSQRSSLDYAQEDEKWRQMLSEVDINGDGLISFDEFSKAIEGFIT